MNSIVGKSTGIALLMAAALLAALFAMGVFSGSGVPVSAHECATNDMGTPIPHGDNADSPVDCAANGHTEAHTGIIKDASVTLSNTASAATGVTMTIEFSVAVGSGEAGRDITVTIPSGVTGYSVEDEDDVSVTQGGADVVSTGTNTILIDGDAAGNYDADDPIVVKITGLINPDADQEPAAVTIQQGSDIPAMPIDSSVSASGGQLRLSSTTAGAAVQVVVKAFAETAKTSATDITVNLAKFGVPSSITERSIIIGDDSSTGHTADTTRYIGEPGSVTVSGTKVTLSLYARFPGSSSDTAGTLEDGYTITFKQSAGITNPGTAGTATVSVGDGDTNGHSLTATIQSAVTLSKGSGARGTDVTVTGVGLGGGGATVFLVDGSCADQVADCTEDDDISLGTGPASGGKVEIDIETSSSDFEQGVDQINENGGVATPPYVSTDSLRGKNQITIVDGTGTTADRSAYFTVTPTIAVDEDAVQQGDELTIIVEDWYYGAIDSVTIGAEVVDEDDLDASGSSDDFEIDIIVPPSARLGEQELKVTGILTDNQGSLTAGNKDVAKGSVIIGALAIEVEPSSFVLGQQFTINVKGFSTDDPETGDDDIMLVKVGNNVLDETTGGVEIDELSIDTNGFFTNTFRLNSKDQYLKPGGYRVQVEDHSGRVALGRITVPEPTITVDPAVSRRGTTVSVTGENFPAGRVVQIYYRDTEDENQQGAVLADSAGKISITFTVPSDAEIGEEQDVTATSAADENDYKAKATHSLPPQEIIVTPMQVAPGGRLTIEGHNMPLYTLVGLKIADISVAGRGAETDGLGSFVKEDVLVPQLKPGTHTVEASVATQGAEAAKVRTTIEIVEAFTTGAPADVFEPLGDRLVRVWYLDRETQVWSFYDPDPDVAAFNTLTEVRSDQNVSIIISSGESVEFQGMILFQATNPISLK